MKKLPTLMASASLVCLLTTAQAADLVLTWVYPLDVQPPPESFLVSYRSASAPQHVEQFRIPNLGAASCEGLAAPHLTLTPDLVCGRAPECLPPGLYMFAVQAETDEGSSDYSNSATCEALPGCTYNCEHVQLPPALQELADVAAGTGTTLPDAQAVAETVEHLANTPIPPAPPSVTTAPPSIQDVIDQVQDALGNRPKTPV